VPEDARDVQIALLAPGYTPLVTKAPKEGILVCDMVRACTIDGFVLNDEGIGVAGTVVDIETLGGGHGSPVDDRLSDPFGRRIYCRSVAADRGGRFQARGLPPGEYALRARLPWGNWGAPVPIKVGPRLDRVTAKVQVPKGAEVDVLSSAGYPLRIEDQVTGTIVRSYTRDDQRVGCGLAMTVPGCLSATGIAPGAKLLLADICNEPRLGGPTAVVIASLKAEGKPSKLDLRSFPVVPAEVSGHAVVTGGPQIDWVLVSARRAEDSGLQCSASSADDDLGRVAFPSADGSYRLHLCPGNYDVVLCDMRTGIVLSKAVALTARAGASHSLDIVAEAVTLRLRLAASSMSCRVRLITSMMNSNARARNPFRFPGLDIASHIDWAETLVPLGPAEVEVYQDPMVLTALGCSPRDPVSVVRTTASQPSNDVVLRGKQKR